MNKLDPTAVMKQALVAIELAIDMGSSVPISIMQKSKLDLRKCINQMGRDAPVEEAVFLGEYDDSPLKSFSVHQLLSE